MSKESINLEIFKSSNVELKMSSREIAELTGKQHKHVLRDIDVLNKSYDNLHLPKVGLMLSTRELPNGGSRKERYYLLTKIQTLDLLTGSLYKSEPFSF